MKYLLSNSDDLLKKITNKEVNALLLYGPDKGAISNIISLIETKLDNISSINYNEWNDSSIEILLNASNFLNNREIIKIINVTESMGANTKRLATETFIHFPIFIASELKNTSSLRKFFELTPSLAIIGCYYDNQVSIKYIKNILEKHNKNISPEAIKHFLYSCNGDFSLIKNELQKLLYYTNNKQNISVEDLLDTISCGTSIDFDELSVSLANKNLENFIFVLQKLLSLGNNEISIIRYLLKYYLNLYSVIDKLDKGDNLDLAIKQIAPQIFFKQIPAFKNAINKYSKSEVVNVLKLLNQAEINYKNHYQTFDLYQYLSCMF